MPRKIFIHREEGEWQILGLFASLEQAKSDLSDNQDIDPDSWTPEDVNGSTWWSYMDHYLIEYEVPDA